MCFTGDCGKLVKLPTLPNSSKVGGKLVWWVLINGLCPTVTHSALARVSLILHTFIVVDVVQLFLLLSPSWPKCVAKLAVARLVCRPLVCRPDGLSPRWLVTILSDPDPMSKYFFSNKSVQNCRRESRQILQCSLFNSLNISRCDYGRRVDSFESIEVKGRSRYVTTN